VESATRWVDLGACYGRPYSPQRAEALILLEPIKSRYKLCRIGYRTLDVPSVSSYVFVKTGKLLTLIISTSVSSFFGSAVAESRVVNS